MTLEATIEAHIAAAVGAPVKVEALEKLPGGACQENFRLGVAVGDGAPRRYVLRSDSRGALPGSLHRGIEARVIAAAVEAGVKTPAARWLGRGLVQPEAWCYFLDWVEGEAIGRRVVKGAPLAAARAQLPEALAGELARIHRVTPATHPALFADAGRNVDAAGADVVRTLLDDLAASLARLPRVRVGLEAALGWLRANIPPAGPVTLAHGDFRVGNFLVAEDGLRGVLDWEFARWGTPAEDLAWIAVRDWRFGQVEQPIGGLCGRARFHDAYRAAGGALPSREALHYWEVLGNVRWAVGSLHQGRRYAEGERDIELIAVAQRAPEMEYEALRLIRRGPESAHRDPRSGS